MEFVEVIGKKEYFEDYFEISVSSPSGLIWKVDRYAGRFNACPVTVKGSVAGYVKKKTGYYEVKLHNKSYKCHRIICVLAGKLEVYNQKLDVDHINGNTSDNRLINLRAITEADNCRNAKMQHNNTSGVNGVHFMKGRSPGWMAWVIYDKRKTSKFFSDSKYPDAFKLACEWRLAKIKELGLVFSERHGLSDGAKQVVQSEAAEKVVKIVSGKLDEYLEEIDKSVKEKAKCISK